MDPLSVTAMTLGLTDGLTNVIGVLSKIVDIYYGTHGSLDDVIWDLTIFQNILTESVLMIQELKSEPRASLVGALRRCSDLQRDLKATLDRLIPKDNTMNKRLHFKLLASGGRIDRVKQINDSFKTAVLLLRDMATDSLTHESLKEVYNINVDCINAISGNRDNHKRKEGHAPGHVESFTVTKPVNLPIFDVSNRREFSDPKYKLSLFNATISYIADIDSKEAVDTNLSTVGQQCECGRRRLGIWFAVRGKFDSGANTDFVSEDVIERAGLQSFVFDVSPEELTMFGKTTSFHRRIQLNWQQDNEEVSYTQTFWVGRDLMADLVIGEPWLMKHGYNNLSNSRHWEGSNFNFFGSLKMRWRGKEQKSREEDKAAKKLAAAVAAEQTKAEQRRLAEQKRLIQDRQASLKPDGTSHTTSSVLSNPTTSTHSQPSNASTSASSVSGTSAVQSASTITLTQSPVAAILQPTQPTANTTVTPKPTPPSNLTQPSNATSSP